MALLARINLYLKYLFTVSCLTLEKYAPAFCIRGVLNFLFVSTVRTFYLLSFNFYSSVLLLLSELNILLASVAIHF